MTHTLGRSAAVFALLLSLGWSNPARSQSRKDGDKDKKPTVEQVANIKLAQEAVEAAGGPVTIGNCKD